jgi:hypothetical protein
MEIYQPEHNLQTCLETLPNELWLLIFQEMDYKAIRFASVSKNFNNLVFQCITNLHLICDHYFYRIGNNKFGIVNIDDQMIQKFVNLRELNYSLARYSVTRPKPEKERSTISITDIGLKSLKNLTTLNLSNRNTLIITKNITDEGIKDLTKLRELNLTNNGNITNLGIKNLTKLRTLDLSLNNNITDIGIKHLTNLTDLILLDNEIITFKGIMEMNNLTHLDLSFTPDSLQKNILVIEKFSQIIDLTAEEEDLFA